MRLLGTVEAMGPEGYFTRWPSRAVAALLGRLALQPQRAHSREELIELLWPGVALDIGRNRLRQALSTLKSLLEGPGPDGRTVITADRSTVRLSPDTVSCDAVEFERALRSGDAERARELYRGELMPGHYGGWVLEERRRLETLHEKLELLPALPPQPDKAPPSTLPAYWTQLYGIELVASRLRALVASRRLVTVCGSGGAGKTRLAVKVAQALRGSPSWPPDGGTGAPHFERIEFVALVDCGDAAQAMEAIAAALRVGGARPQEAVFDLLAGQRSLLVLDNFEQLAAQARAVIEPLLSRAPDLHLLVTSRRRLRLDGEQLFELGGLPLPEAGAGDEVDLASPAVALFVDRARAARPGFQPAAGDGATLRELVRRLDGMPLAIELAASRLRNRSPQALLQRLNGEAAGAPSMLELLARHAPGDAEGGGRHDSMRRVIESSLRELTPPTMALLEALVPFAAPARVEAIAAVAAVDVEHAAHRLEVLDDCSLVHTRDDATGTARHVLLQPVREYLAGRIAPEAARRARQRLRAWLQDFGAPSLAQGPHALAAEEAHLLASLVSAPADGAPREALALAVSVARYWELDRGVAMPPSAVDALESALPAAADDPGLLSDACELLAFCRAAAGGLDAAERHVEAAIAHAPDARSRSRALARKTWIAVFSGRYDAQMGERLEEAIALAQRAGDRVTEAVVLRMQCMYWVNVHQDYARAEAASERAQHLFEALGDHRNAYRRLLDRAVCWGWTGREDQASVALAACERAATLDRDPLGIQAAAWQLGRVSVRLRRGREAAAAFRRGLMSSHQQGNAINTGYVMLHAADALVMCGHDDEAARVQGFAVPHWERRYGAINPIALHEVRRTRRWLRRRLGTVRAEALRLEGSQLALATAVNVTLRALAAAGDGADAPPAAPPFGND